MPWTCPVCGVDQELEEARKGEALPPYWACRGCTKLFVSDGNVVKLFTELAPEDVGGGAEPKD